MPTVLERLTRKQLRVQVRRVLAANRTHGHEPRSIYQYAQMTGIGREQYYMFLNGQKMSRRVRESLLALVARKVNGRAA